MGDSEALTQEELRQEDHEAEDQRVDRDQNPTAHDHALQDRRPQHGRRGELRDRRGNHRWRQRTAAGGFLLDRLHQGFRFRASTFRFQPARGFRQILAQIPDDQRADAGDDEHRPPAETRNDQIAKNGGDRESRHHQERHESEPAAARLRRHELGQRRIADHDLGAQAQPLHETADDELAHILREGGGERGEPEDQEVDLIGEAPAIFVADKAGDQRAERHANEGQGEELQVLRQRREFGLDRGRQHAAGDVEIVAVEEHAGADQPEDAIVKRRDREPVETCAGVHCASHLIPPC